MDLWLIPTLFTVVCVFLAFGINYFLGQGTADRSLTPLVWLMASALILVAWVAYFVAILI